MMFKEEIKETYGGKIRIRVCGVLIKDNSILLVQHKLKKNKELFWSPPGGGVKFGERLTDALKREFLEETNLEVEVGKFLTIHEYIEDPLHAIDLFFEITKYTGSLKVGSDPELSKNQQSIADCTFFNLNNIKKSKKNIFHPILFQLINKN